MLGQGGVQAREGGGGTPEDDRGEGRSEGESHGLSFDGIRSSRDGRPHRTAAERPVSRSIESKETDPS